jgi:hypothetical protein
LLCCNLVKEAKASAESADVLGEIANVNASLATKTQRKPESLKRSFLFISGFSSSLSQNRLSGLRSGANDIKLFCP